MNKSKSIEAIFDNLADMVADRVIQKMLQKQKQPQRPVDMPTTINAKKAAEVAGVSLATVYDWMHRSDCDFCIPVGRKKVILYDKFIAWLERQTTAGENADRR